MTTKETPGNSFIRTVTTVVVLIGAVISAILTFNAGHKNASVILPVLFLIWVLSPFIMLLLVNYKFSRYSGNVGIIKYVLMILLSLVSVIAYTGILSPAGAKPAAIFLFTPLISWVFIILLLVIKRKTK